MLKQFIKNRVSPGLWASARVFWWELRVMRTHRKGSRLARRYAGQQQLKLHIGCGHKIKAGWVNIDLSRWADIGLDLRLPMPFPDGSCSVIYSEHFLEHLGYPGEVDSFLKECHRVLQPCGMFRAGVPDTEWALLEYAGQVDRDYFTIAKEHWHPEWCQTEAEHVNYHFRQDGQHQFAYDFKTLSLALRRAGFDQVESSGFDTEMDTDDREMGTLYVNAFKHSATTKSDGIH